MVCPAWLSEDQSDIKIGCGGGYLLPGHTTVICPHSDVLEASRLEVSKIFLNLPSSPWEFISA